MQTGPVPLSGGESRAAPSAGTVITAVRPVTGTEVGAGWNAPPALTADPAMMTALEVGDGAVSSYSLPARPAEARVTFEPPDTERELGS